jgi:hypothetical protein
MSQQWTSSKGTSTCTRPSSAACRQADRRPPGSNLRAPLPPELALRCARSRRWPWLQGGREGALRAGQYLLGFLNRLMAMHVKNLDSSWGGVRRQLGRSSLCRLELKATRYQLFPGRRATWCDGLEASTPPYDGGIFESAPRKDGGKQQWPTVAARRALRSEENADVASSGSAWLTRGCDRQAGDHSFEPSTAHSLDVEVTTKRPNGHIFVIRSLRRFARRTVQFARRRVRWA